MVRMIYGCSCCPLSLMTVLHYLLTIACAALGKNSISADRSSLLALRAQITSDPREFLSKNWSDAFSACDWIGVKCGSRHGRVTELNISSMNLTGTLPPHLGNLSFLVYLDMHNNNFHGGLPEEFSRLRRLRFMNLCLNNLSGEVPVSFGHLSELQSMLLYNNSFTGAIPVSFSNLSKLQTLDLYSNFLEGTIPERIGNLPKLRRLILAVNQLAGFIPFSIFNITTLEFLSLSYNNLYGSLPDDICRGQLPFPKLKAIHLAWIQLNGSIPTGLSWCSQLQVLTLAENNFTGNIPKEIMNLQLLEELYLDGNQLEGEIPMEIGNLWKLGILYVDKNQITGSIPREIGNLTTLSVLHFGVNNLTGHIPNEIGNLQDLVELHLPYNYLGGSIPFGVFNLSSAREIALENNFFTGGLPSNLGNGLPNLEKLYLTSNNVRGTIPASIANSSRLTLLSLDDNHFEGLVPNSLGDLSLLEELSLAKNNLTTQPSSSELDFITSLTNCRHLRIMLVSENPFYGFLPGSLGNFSASVEKIYAYGCNMKGSIPGEIGNLSSIIGINLDENQLTGVIPESVKDLQSLQLFSLRINKLGGFLNMFCGLRNLAFLYLTQNHFSGSIPECLGNMTSLRDIFLGSNRLTSKIPKNLWNLKNLLRLELSSNYLSGSLAQEIGNLKVAITMDLSCNNISGNIPNETGSMTSLAHLNLASNNLTGHIPESFGELVSLESLNLSLNNLTGLIPKSMETLRSLQYFNVSFNYLRGEIPSGGPFRNFTSESFISNDELCGEPKFHVPQCHSSSASKSRTWKHLRYLFSLLGIAPVISAVAIILYLRFRRKCAIPWQEPNLLEIDRCSYYELWQATNGYNERNLLGSGCFGSVYKGILKDGRFVAVKVFKMQQEGAVASFDVESRIIPRTRHRNLVKIISCCCKPGFKALVLEYMSNGNLENRLHCSINFLNIMQRIDIMIDVANALRYLHHEYSVPIVHCDLKPSNILLDDDMVGRVSDFGLSKWLGIENSVTFTKTFATFGYIAPEYGSYGLISTKCDVYSFGIILMEVFTGRKPDDERFYGKWTLKSWVAKSMPKRIFRVADAKLLEENEQPYTEKLDCLRSIMDLALNCVVESPRDRLNIKDVVDALIEIKEKFVHAHISFASRVESLVWPPERYFKINFHGTIYKDLEGYYGVGVVVRDSHGRFVAGLAKMLEGRATPAHAEAAAARAAVEFGRELNLSRIRLEGDCGYVIDLLGEAEDEDLSVLGLIIEETKARLAEYRAVELGWVRQDCNRVACEFAQQARFFPSGGVWRENAPSFIESVLEAENSVMNAQDSQNF